jgi:hypothetical protein
VNGKIQQGICKRIRSKIDQFLSMGLSHLSVL